MNCIKMAGQFICKMAMPLALMFAACSTDDGNGVSKVEGAPGTQMGGSSEEPGIVASLRVRAYYAPASEDESSGDLMVSIPENVFLVGGKIVLTEIDSVTLEPFGDTSFTAAFDGSGVVSFDSVLLRSPIVSLEAISKSYYGENVSLKAIVDVRNVDAIVIDGLSHLVAGRIKKLVDSGLPFDSARTRAELEIAKVLGFDAENPFLGEDQEISSIAALRRKTFNELVSFDLLKRLKGEIGESGTDIVFSEDAKDLVSDHVERLNTTLLPLIFSSKFFENMDEASALYYQECLQKKAYYASLLAGVFGYGGCSAENEGASVDLSGRIYELKCTSNSWELVYIKANRLNIGHTFGTMIDARDGNTYKTVTIDLGGTSQTWMAENLNYASDNSYCFKDDSLYCLVYGRDYEIWPILDSSYIKYSSEEECIADRADSAYCEFFNEDWDGSFDQPDSRNIDWNKVMDSLEVLNIDVCPEGWRLPLYEEWNSLLAYLSDIGETFGMNLLLAAYGDPAGFGLEFLPRIRSGNGYFRVVIQRVPSYMFKPTFVTEDIRNRWQYVLGDVVGTVGARTISRAYGPYYEVKDPFFGWPAGGFVRCVKDE